MTRLAGRRMAAVALVLTMIGCGDPAPSATERPSPSPSPAPAVSIPLYEAPVLEGPAAALRGQLALKGSCLVVRTDVGIHGVVWPAPRTRWDPAGVIHVGDASAAVGGEVVLGGGATAIAGHTLRASLGWLGPPDATCVIEPLWFAVDLDPAE